MIPRTTRLSGAALVAFAVAATPFAQASAMPPAPGQGAQHQRADDLPHPLGNEQREKRQKALDKLIEGKASVVTKGGEKVITYRAAGRTQYAPYGAPKSAKVLTVLSEFGDQVDTRYGGQPGPLHNQIPDPGDDSRIWKPDFNTEHYDTMLFGDQPNSFKDFYRTQSRGLFSVDGQVSDWVTLPFNGARYGSNLDEAEAYWAFVKDSANAWYEAQKAQGKSAEQITAELAEYDVEDRYDFDGDGNFNEPDGYIDHFQAIHAGMGEEAGGGEDAIWSHRWYAFQDGIGKEGPQGNLNGGTQIGDSGFWVGDYTTEPEDGGMGVFAHEFGHDLGLPDYYDTTYGGTNGTGFWTAMSQGSWAPWEGRTPGSSITGLDAQAKLELGWLDFQKVQPGENVTTTIGPAHTDTDAPEAVVVPLGEEGKYFLFENRQYGGYDKALANPFASRPLSPYQNGMLAWYHNADAEDDNTSEHPGSGLTLPVDANPQPLAGGYRDNTFETLDAPFGLEARDEMTIEGTKIPSSPAVPVFEDRGADSYFRADNGTNSVQLPGSGVRAQVMKAEGEALEVCFGAADACTTGTPDETVDRWAGKDRYATAAEVARQFGDSDTVYLTSGQGFADAMSASPAAASGVAPRSVKAAGGKHFPVLLTRTDRIPADTLQALQDLGAKKVVLLGGEAAVSGKVAGELGAKGLEVARVDGADRYETSANVATMFGTDVDTVYVASGEEKAYADALTGSALAGSQDAPVLLTRPDRVDQVTKDALASLRPKKVVVLGGPAAVSDAVYAELGGTERLAGSDRYGTSAAVAAQFDKDPNRALVASGMDYPDALTGGAWAGANDAPLVLTRKDRLPAASKDALDALSPQDVAIIGGTAAVVQTVEDQLNELLAGWVD